MFVAPFSLTHTQDYESYSLTLTYSNSSSVIVTVVLLACSPSIHPSVPSHLICCCDLLMTVVHLVSCTIGSFVLYLSHSHRVQLSHHASSLSSMYPIPHLVPISRCCCCGCLSFMFSFTYSPILVSYSLQINVTVLNPSVESLREP